MKMLNKKGFVLVETLIVTAFVVTLFIIVYQNVIPYIGEYEKMSSYDDVDSVYASNLMKQVIIKYADLNYIDTQLKNNTYVNISDCSNSLIYRDQDYCLKVKNTLGISNDDYILLTRYDISSFREEVKKNDFFDSGKLSNFRSYINTVSNLDTFYDPSDNTKQVSGKYRLFMTRTVTNSDLSTSMKYVNIGVFLGNYTRYYAGDMITFNPGGGDRNFYVLKDSSSKESTLTLILANNLGDSINFNSTGVSGNPDTLLSYLKQMTDTWVNTKSLTSSNQFSSSDGYTIYYNNYHARLLDENDIYNLLGCRVSKKCFDVGSLFETNLSNTKFLYDNLNNNGYWLASTVNNNSGFAWTVQNGKLAPMEITGTNNIGLRPVIVIDKDKLK